MTLSSHHLLAFVDTVVSDIITPALDSRFQISRVTLFCDEESLQSTGNVAEVLREASVPVSILPIRPEWNAAAAFERLRMVLAASEQPCLINLSGASPLQAAVAQQVALEHKAPCFVVHPQDDELLWLTPPPANQPAEHTDLADTLRLESYFGLYGHELAAYQYRLGELDDKTIAIAGRLVRLAAEHPETIHALNWAGSELNRDYVSRRHVPKNMGQLRKLLEQTGIADWQADGNPLNLSKITPVRRGNPLNLTINRLIYRHVFDGA